MRRIDSVLGKQVVNVEFSLKICDLTLQLCELLLHVTSRGQAGVSSDFTFWFGRVHGRLTS